MRRGSLVMSMMAALTLALAAVGCSAEPEPETGQDVSGNQPICVEAVARVTALCKGAPAPSFDTACSGNEHCRAGCIYDHPCDASAQSACITKKGC